MDLNIIILLIISYISGSIPYGMILIKILGYGDIRKIGSGNIGATNVLRTGNKIIAIAVLFFDILKCFLPTYLVIYLYNYDVGLLCGLFCIIGHIFPIWLNFKGGKGVACLFGFILATNPLFFLIILIIWLIVAYISKYSSLGSIISTVTMVFLFLIYETNINIVIPLIISALILFKHKKNIKRLITKKENKIKL
tara:strand:+ start:5316 stop:5900 length:585 start_codon:yes stop_codon:yes gene_type:complete